MITAALPTSRTTHANMAVLPLITVTFLGVVRSIDGVGVTSGVVLNPKGST